MRNRAKTGKVTPPRPKAQSPKKSSAKPIKRKMSPLAGKAMKKVGEKGLGGALSDVMKPKKK
jgi:hypothetical protein